VVQCGTVWYRVVQIGRLHMLLALSMGNVVQVRFD
jgi:hypothetical protein